ncbi:hypothetical protein [Dulcicalothrix desertica]|nr:hypothetical protein [Dulcicalothrix desertica]TWH62763.1 hypothetical protein CAL7102_00286 [Dulcicalothrix desertica PCC 7102]
MKKQLISTFFIICCYLPNSAMAQVNDGHCNSPYQRLVEKVDQEASVCHHTSMDDGEQYFTITRYDTNNQMLSYVSVTSAEDGIKTVRVSDKQSNLDNDTVFTLDRRTFKFWITYPNANLVNRYKSDITAILDAMEKHAEKPVQNF